MAKNKARDNERRAIAEKLRKEQQRQERRRSTLILGGCLVLVVGLLAAALIPYVRDQREKSRLAGTPLEEMGASLSSAACDDVQEKTATGNQDHVPSGTRIDYPDAPPSFGKHWGNFLVGSEIRTFYSPDDRPEAERLVHSLEHGYTILWYDDTVKAGTSSYEQVQALADKLEVGDKFIAAPWTAADGGQFPSGKHVALTHWTGPQDQKGMTQYCAKPSGEAVATFMEDYPASDTPEPGAA